MVTVSNAPLVNELSRQVVLQVAPQETPIFDAVSQSYFSNPHAALNTLDDKDEILGFGAGTSIFVTPVVLIVVSEVVNFLFGIAKKAVEDGLSSEASAAVKGMLARFREEEPSAPPMLTPEQLGIIHKNALRAAKRLNLPAEKARSLADAITAQLVVPVR